MCHLIQTSLKRREFILHLLKQSILLCLSAPLWASQVTHPVKDPESAWNAGDSTSIPGLGSSPGEGISCPLQYSWASQVAQTVKNLPAMQEIWVQPLGWEDSLEEGMATHLVSLPGEYPCTEEPGRLQSTASQRETTEQLSTAHSTVPL